MLLMICRLRGKCEGDLEEEGGRGGNRDEGGGE